MAICKYVGLVDGTEYTITVEGDIEVDPDGTDAILNFTETISQWGGLPKYMMATTVQGTPQNFKTADSTPFYAEQTGSVTGRYSYPSIPDDAIATVDGTSVKTEERITRVSPSEHLSSTDGSSLTHQSYTISYAKSFMGTAAFGDGTLTPDEWDGT